MTRRVLIIGAGFTGLALANGLRRAGDIEVTVVEQAPVITEAGWAISLTDRHLEALRQLGLVPRDLTADPLARTIMFDPNTSVPVRITAMDGVVTTRSELQLWLWEPVGALVRGAQHVEGLAAEVNRVPAVAQTCPRALAPRKAVSRPDGAADALGHAHRARGSCSRKVWRQPRVGQTRRRIRTTTSTWRASTGTSATLRS
ncbi:hypothetical protein Misp02_63430 [Microtetraspora sp. NBRC 16547]|nr:hypothetical protein Misp02_63430 [Microtetraspora sp. NBRC 16547]